MGLEQRLNDSETFMADYFTGLVIVKLTQLILMMARDLKTMSIDYTQPSLPTQHAA